MESKAVSDRQAYGDRHRQVAIFMALVVLVWGLLALVLLVFGSDALARSAPFLPRPVQTMGFLVALLLVLSGRSIYMLWRYPPIEISNGALRVLRGARRVAYDLARIGGPIEEESTLLGFQRLAFRYDGRRRVLDLRIVPPDEQAALRKRLETIIDAHDS